MTVPAAAVFSAFGYKAHNPFQETVEKLCSEVYTIGSNVKAGTKNFWKISDTGDWSQRSSLNLHLRKVLISNAKVSRSDHFL